MATVLQDLEFAVSSILSRKLICHHYILSILGVITTSTCSSTISTNTTYIRNPNYPSSYTATSAGTCAYTISKVSDDICQLRLDFQTFSGFATTTGGACNDYFTAAGQTGKNPPNICGTNTGYHSKNQG